MSTIQTNAIVDASGGNTTTVNGISPLANTARFGRNLIINGDFKVAQRGTTFAAAAGGTFVSDRWSNLAGGATGGKIGYTRSTDAPAGFKYSTKLDVSTAMSSLASNDFYIFRYRGFERQDIEHLNYGTSDAKQITLSFWVKSNKTGTMYAEFQVPTSSGSMELSKPYTVDAVNTWEYKTLTWPPNTVHTTNAADNGVGLYLYMWIASGANIGSPLATSWNNNSNRVPGITNYLDSTSNEIYFTGFQLEVGDTATDFEHRSYGDVLAKCQRYYQNYIDYDYATLGAGRGASGGDLVVFTCPLPTQMRANPTITTNGAYYVYDHNSRSLTTPTSVSQSQGDATKNTNITLAMAFSSVVCDDDRVCVIGGHEANYILFDAEL